MSHSQVCFGSSELASGVSRDSSLVQKISALHPSPQLSCPLIPLSLHPVGNPKISVTVSGIHAKQQQQH